MDTKLRKQETMRSDPSDGFEHPQGSGDEARGGRSPLLIIVRGMEIFRMDTKSEKLALFRFGLFS
jgi:hypothetical protein